jgi:hypothetical protein
VKALATIVAVTSAAAGFVFALIAYGFIGWGWSDSGGHWNTAQWILTIIPWSIPFWVLLWISYRCCGSSWKQTVMAEAAGLAIVLLLGATYRFHIRDLPVLVERQPPLLEIRDSGYRPRLPLGQPAAGIEGADGKFVPMMFLVWPPPGWNFQDLTFHLETAPPEIKVYRGTNAVAADNYFLGKFQITGSSKSQPTLDVILFFQLSGDRQLFLMAREKSHNTHLKLRRIDAATEGP